MLVCTTAWAADVFYTLDGTITGGNNGYATESDITQNGMQWKVMGNTDISPWRIGGKSLTGVDRPVYSTTPMGSAITNISLEVGAASNITVNSLKLIVASDAAFTNQLDEVTGTFVASSTIDFVPTSGTEWAANAYYKFVFNVTVSGSTNRFVEFKNAIFYAEAGAAPAVATPVISFDKAAPYVGDNVTCTITCATEGASIQYSTDGETYQNYSAPFTLTETTTVYAKATLGDDVSAVAEKTVTFTPITTVADIAALTALQNGTEFRMAQNWTATVVYVSGNFVYIKDNSGSTLLYDVTKNNPELAAGYTISNLYGKVSIYNGLFEVGKPATYSAEATSVVVNPDVMAVNNITADNVNQYVKLEGVTLSAISSNYFTINGTLTGRNRFSVDYPNSPTEGTYDVTGFVGYDSGNSDNMLQFWPTAFEDVTPVAAVEKPVIAFDKENPVEGETVNCTITCETQGATIMYALGEGDFQAYIAAFPLTETTTVKAKAVLGQDESSVATATITFSAPPVELDGMIVFKDNDNDGAAMTESEEFMGQIEKGNNYVAGAEDMVFVYPGKEGLKIGKSGGAGSMTLNLKNMWNATKISFIAKRYNAGKAVTMTVNGQTKELTGDFALYEIALNPAEEVQAITLATTQYAFLKVINIEGQEIAPSNYTITLDNAPGNYTSNIVVKATVAPELPEGAKLYYTFLPTGSTATAQEKEYKAGVRLFQSGTLTFILRDADNAELATAGGEYTVPPFGDINGDGKTDVSDVNELVNVILGKFSMDVNN